ncbi:hypothetical protein ALQ56_200229 [Pseudomonas syringae pv. papulans]|nr:hypothetical protein ALQ56_200229 [Pseudomonas syringae pv. papulans]
MSIFLDGNNEVESIYFQAFESFLAEIYKACQNEAVFSGAEIFIPEEMKSFYL